MKYRVPSWAQTTLCAGFVVILNVGLLATILTKSAYVPVFGQAGANVMLVASTLLTLVAVAAKFGTWRLAQWILVPAAHMMWMLIAPVIIIIVTLFLVIGNEITVIAIYATSGLYALASISLSRELEKQASLPKGHQSGIPTWSTHQAFLSPETIKHKTTEPR